MTRTLALAAVIIVLLTGACSTQPPPPSVQKRTPSAPVSLVAQVRAAGRADADALDVQPLRDPQVEDLRQTATRLEGQGDYDGAAASIAKALALRPQDPGLLQQAAEFALYRRAWDEAARFATRSYEHGPKIGSLCRSNWATIRIVADARGDAAGAAAARQRIVACTAAPPARM